MTTFNIKALYAATFALTLISTITAQQPRAMDAKVLKTAGTAKDAMPGTWLTYGLTQTEQRYSQLKQIDEPNVGKLGLAWSAPLSTPGGRGGTEGTPLMWNNTIYQTMDNSIVYALDARTGEQKWMYDAKIDPITPSHMCCGTHNRGLAIYDGKLILAANDARLIALDAVTGKELWQSKVADIEQVLLVHHRAAHRGRQGNRRRGRRRVLHSRLLRGVQPQGRIARVEVPHGSACARPAYGG